MDLSGSSGVRPMMEFRWPFGTQALQNLVGASVRRRVSGPDVEGAIMSLIWTKSPDFDLFDRSLIHRGCIRKREVVLSDLIQRPQINGFPSENVEFGVRCGKS